MRAVASNVAAVGNSSQNSAACELGLSVAISIEVNKTHAIFDDSLVAITAGYG